MIIMQPHEVIISDQGNQIMWKKDLLQSLHHALILDYNSQEISL